MGILEKMGIKIKEITTEAAVKRLENFFFCDFIVDAIFGIGFKGALTGVTLKTAELINRTRKPVYALDVPSGLDATKGLALGPCVKARETITFGYPKRGFLVKGARKYIGKLTVRNIGFPGKAFKI